MDTFYERYTRVAIARTLHASDIEVLKREQGKAGRKGWELSELELGIRL